MNQLGIGEPIRQVSNEQIERLLQSMDGCQFERRAQPIGSLGEGAYGRVDVYRIEKCQVAVKSGHGGKSLHEEAQVHWRATQCQKCSHTKHIVPLLMSYYCANTNRLLLVLPVYTHGTLHDEIQRLRKQNADPAAYVILLNKRRRQGVDALRWLHKQCRIVHNDAHEENWFVTDADSIVLADFGEARLAEEYRSQAQFDKMCQYELLGFERSLAADRDEKRDLQQRLNRLEHEITKDKSLAKDIAGRPVL